MVGLQQRSYSQTRALLAGLVVGCFVQLGASRVEAGFRDASDALGFSGGGQVSFVDFNNDGWVDIHAGKLYRNEKGKRFVVVKDAPGGAGIWGDFDNDGHPDFFSYSGKGALFRNLGDGIFKQLPFPELPTVNSLGAVWADVNNDGLLDLYVGGYEIWTKRVHPDAIFLNHGKGVFKEHWRSPAGQHYSARGVTAADFDEDGAIDIYVSNYRLQPNFLWKNDGRGKFTEVGAKYKAAGNKGPVIGYTGGIRYGLHGHTIGSCFGDLDDDGHLDLFVGNFAHPRAHQDRPQFLRNRGPAGGFLFEDKSKEAGLAFQESFASPALGDFDNDGDLDLFFTTVYPVASGGIRNFPVLYRNEGNWKFRNVTGAEKIPNLPATYQAAWADIDNDGDLDLCTAGKLFVNENRKHHWIEITLVGDGRTVNRSAIGATVRIRVGKRVITRHVEGGTGQGNQNDMRLHFGLGEHDAPVALEITWPGKHRQRVEGLTVNRQHRVDFRKDR